MRIKLPGKLGQLWLILEPGQAIRSGPPIQTRLIVNKFDSEWRFQSSQDLGSGLVTTAGVNLMAADWTSANAALKIMNYHDTGTGTLTPSIGDTAMQLPTGIARGVGTQSNTANVYQTIANVTFNNAYLVTEWGLFSLASGGTMWDHKTWSGTNVHTGDILQFVYQLSILAGG